jgi:hypothetical protein
MGLNDEMFFKKRKWYVIVLLFIAGLLRFVKETKINISIVYLILCTLTLSLAPFHNSPPKVTSMLRFKWSE